VDNFQANKVGEYGIKEVLEATTVPAAFQAAAAAGGERIALRTFGGGEALSWSDYAARVRCVACGLAALGVGHADTVAMQLRNRPEFHIIDMAAAHLGATPFGVYNTSTPRQICDRLENSDTRVYVVERGFLPVVEKVMELYRDLEHLIVLDVDAVEHGLTLSEVEQAGGTGSDFDFDFDFEGRWRSVSPDDIVTIIYTSGTTGPPKGAQWSHANVMAVLRSWATVLPLPHASVSYLPLAHAGERMLTHYMPLGEAGTVTSVPDHTKVMNAVREAHPDFLATVPRTWVKLRSAIEAQIDATECEAERAALKNAIATGLRRVDEEAHGLEVTAELAESHEAAKAVLRTKVLEPWGLDQLNAALIGSAPPPQDVILYFLALGVPLLEAYGMTEATGFGATWPCLEDFKLGTVGKPMPGTELSIANDGEILLRGPMNMVGYRKQPEASAMTIDQDGWLHTGDLGELDEDGFLILRGRKKELIINQSGKNMSPSNIESAIKTANPFLGHVVAIGDGRPYLVALITLDSDGAAALARKHSLEEDSVAAVASSPTVNEEVANAVEAGNQELSRVEQIKKFKLLDVEWAPDSDELTPTMKLKRAPIAQKYAKEIEALYVDTR
jgi:long-chain acyl-CoA synthetase